MASGARGADLAQLQVGARGYVRVAAAVVVRQVGDRTQLDGVEDAVRDAQSQHERILRRRHVKQAVEFI
jgi:hypothetical protein